MGYTPVEGVEPHGDYYLWEYVPSLPAAAVFTVLFSILTFAHFFRMFKHRLWFMLAFTVGGNRTFYH